MNQRIRELAQQAGLLLHNPENKETKLDVFAELLIQECIKAAGNPADGLINADTWHDGVRASVESIKLSFGVEE